MLPYVARRPISLVRCPEGIDKEHFFQRHAMKGMSKAVKQVPIPGGESKKPYLYIDDEEGLFALVQIGVLEIHDWGVSLPKVSQPDHIVFDLDPDEELDFPILKAAAVEVRDFLAELGFKTFLKATGGKGLHVVAPLDAEARLGRGERLRQGGGRRAGRRRGPTATRRTWRRRSATGQDLRRLSAQSARRHGHLQLFDPRAQRRDGGRAAPLGRAEGARKPRRLTRSRRCRRG